MYTKKKDGVRERRGDFEFKVPTIYKTLIK